MVLSDHAFAVASHPCRSYDWRSLPEPSPVILELAALSDLVVALREHVSRAGQPAIGASKQSEARKSAERIAKEIQRAAAALVPCVAIPDGLPELKVDKRVELRGGDLQSEFGKLSGCAATLETYQGSYLRSGNHAPQVKNALECVAIRAGHVAAAAAG